MFRAHTRPEISIVSPYSKYSVPLFLSGFIIAIAAIGFLMALLIDFTVLGLA